VHILVFEQGHLMGTDRVIGVTAIRHMLFKFILKKLAVGFKLDWPGTGVVHWSILLWGAWLC